MQLINHTNNHRRDTKIPANTNKYERRERARGRAGETGSDWSSSPSSPSPRHKSTRKKKRRQKQEESIHTTRGNERDNDHEKSLQCSLPLLLLASLLVPGQARRVERKREREQRGERKRNDETLPNELNDRETTRKKQTNREREESWRCPGSCRE
jgi:hypothetical protein